MADPHWHISPGFAAFPAVFLLLVFLAHHLSSAPNSLRTRALIVVTRSEERTMAAVLAESPSGIDGLTNFNRISVFEPLLVGNNHLGRLKTNASGQIINPWQMPYRIALATPINFALRSAGPNRKFGDKDDIVLNGALNSIAQP